MPTPERQSPNHEIAANELAPDPERSAEHEPRHKTVAVRVEEEIHSQLQFIAQLGGTSISQEIRTAIQTRIDSAQDDPLLIERAQEIRQEIEREAAARTAAIAGFMGQRATATTVDKPVSAPRGRRSTKPYNE